MRKEEKMQVLQAQPVGYYSGFGGIEVKSIEYGIDDSVVFVAGAWTGCRSAHRARIYYGDRPYFVWQGVRIHFDDVLRV